ncbi:uncharacterized protein LOC125220448 [Salvia hispanica]|uniref:uncharacterized protein LOC125220448 n=1 Tax=Salvia hispanica TaxID=49212 RepID=UPI00200968B3|nr:uncharacterized protein LOC125220448 [Salvia hispanica]
MANDGDVDPSRRIDEELWAHTSVKINRLVQEHLRQQQQPAVPRPIHHQVVVPRDHLGAHQRLFDDYLTEEPWENASGRPGHSSIQKCTAAIRQLAYGGAADMFDEYLHIGESETTARECLQHFCRAVIHIFGDTYLRKPTPDDCQCLMDVNRRVHSFPEMLGSIDCIIRTGSTARKGIYTTGFKSKNPTMILEAVDDYRLWI